MHPLAPDLTKLTEDELHTKRAELQNRLGYAYRIGNADMIQQLTLLQQDYTLEVERRYKKMLDDVQKNNPKDPNGPKDITY
jgi:hypothetical protein